MAILVDVAALSEQRTNAALEFLCKASHDDDDDAIWAPHESPFIRRLIELFTQRGLMRLDGFRAELEKWLAGERHRRDERPPRPPGVMERWSRSELALVRLYLETLPPEQWTLDDHMMLVDWLVQRYLPADDLRTEAEWLATRAVLMGRVQANMAKLSAKDADTVLAALPSTAAEAAEVFAMNHVQRAVLDFANARVAENVRALANDARHRIRTLIAQDLERKVLGIPSGADSGLQTKLLDAFGVLNRDWRRIAVTEAGEAANQGFVASLKPGTRLKRIEQYRGACAFCRKIDGKIVEVVAPDAPNKDGDTMVWPGKTNIGRSAAPRKRVGRTLIAREPHEMWWIPAGTAHPHCRGRWLPAVQDRPGDDPEFGAWLRELLEKKSP